MNGENKNLTNGEMERGKRTRYVVEGGEVGWNWNWKKKAKRFGRALQRLFNGLDDGDGC